jgi:hypothetical protein
MFHSSRTCRIWSWLGSFQIPSSSMVRSPELWPTTSCTTKKGPRASSSIGPWTSVRSQLSWRRSERGPPGPRVACASSPAVWSSPTSDSSKPLTSSLRRMQTGAARRRACATVRVHDAGGRELVFEEARDRLWENAGPPSSGSLTRGIVWCVAAASIPASLPPNLSERLGCRRLTLLRASFSPKANRRPAAAAVNFRAGARRFECGSSDRTASCASDARS